MFKAIVCFDGVWFLGSARGGGLKRPASSSVLPSIRKLLLVRKIQVMRLGFQFK